LDWALCEHRGVFRFYWLDMLFGSLA
jgi:hypothetical protein